jgi:hypothetical protein
VNSQEHDIGSVTELDTSPVRGSGGGATVSETLIDDRPDGDPDRLGTRVDSHQNPQAQEHAPSAAGSAIRRRGEGRRAS